MKTDHRDSTLRWSVLGVFAGGILGVGTARWTVAGGEHPLAGYFGWALVSLSQILGETRTWKICAIGIAYYGAILGLAFGLAATRKWLWLGGWILFVVVAHTVLSRYEAQTFFEAVRLKAK